ncbi:hypothetical protein ASE86_14880 [Sphingomonas sp. Leaf33]|nr:hypothetical protein ASE86_14880 [Sphingomonas sp. Leaf33]
MAKHGDDRDLAFAQAVGSPSVELFHSQGDGHVAVLRHHGLTDGMAVYDLGCGCGRTAQALQRSGWTGKYIGHDIVPGFIDELRAKCPGYEAHVHRRPSLLAGDETLDLIFHWSVFTHLPPEECYLYLRDSFRALKPGGRIVFSFLELTDPAHWVVFDNRVDRTAREASLPLMDTFLHRDWIVLWAERLGFTRPDFTDGSDETHHAPFWQALATMTKPAG